MIDKVKMNTIVHIPNAMFTRNNWRSFRIRGSVLYCHIVNGVRIYYSVNTSRLSIIGRLYNLSDNRNRVGNLDLLYEGMAGIHVEQEAVTKEDGSSTTVFQARAYTQNLNQLIEETSRYINTLLDIQIDIRTFTVTYIEFCFNIQTPYVREYCRMFNKVFRERHLASYTNDVSRRRLPEDSGFYVKSNAQYRDNTRDRFTINFYNKVSQLTHLISETTKDFGPDRFGDITGSVNILRMEVQVGYSALYQLNRNHGIGRNFESYLNPGIARDIIARQYGNILSGVDLDFFSYSEACTRIEESEYDRSTQQRIRQYLLNYVRHQHAPSRNTMYSYRRLLDNIGIHWCLIPSSYNRSHLESPITLLDCHIEQLEENKENMSRRFLIAELEAELYGSIEVEEEEVVEIPNEVLDEVES